VDLVPNPKSVLTTILSRIVDWHVRALHLSYRLHFLPLIGSFLRGLSLRASFVSDNTTTLGLHAVPQLLGRLGVLCNERFSRSILAGAIVEDCAKRGLHLSELGHSLAHFTGVWVDGNHLRRRKEKKKKEKQE